MTEISGSLKLVTGSPAAVSQVWLRAPNGRVQGSEYVTEAPDTVPVTGGAVSFDALPGAMVMTLVSHGSPMHTVKLLVPDKTSATLAECIEAAELATDGTRSALERLALEVQAELGQVPSLVSDALAQDATIIDAVKQASVIREDTTVGTRVFAGDTMIFGDTGWRDITSLHNTDSPLELGAGSKIFIRRMSGDVYFRLLGPITARAAFGAIVRIVAGWRPELDTEVSLTRGVAVRHSRYWISIESATQGGTIASANRSVVAQWPTMESWPSSLPGTPI